MTEQDKNQLPTWSPRLRKTQIARLYQSSARGLPDEELIDEVGFALLARAESMLTVGQAFAGRLPCPKCKATVERGPHGPDELLQCGACGWQCPWAAYHKTIKRKGLFAGGLQPCLEEFVHKFPKAKSHAARLILIDTLIHQYHWQASSGTGRPGASSLIEGKISNIMPFLDSLSYGDHLPEEAEQTREQWRQKWANNPWKKRVEGMTARNRPPSRTGD